VLRRREAWRRQQQNRRSRQRIHATSKQPTQKQLQQGEQIVNFAFAAVTSTQLGLRVQGVTLVQDFEDAQHQRHALPCDEHTTLYRTGEQAHATNLQRQPVPLDGDSGRFMANATVERSSSHDKQSSSEFYNPMPTRNASSPILTQNHNRDRSVSAPSHESERSFSGSSRSSTVLDYLALMR
jgi:hypothetical protein